MTLHIPTHKSFLISILTDIYSDPDVGPFLGFKGGTAAYFFYDLPRFSVDLDFDLLDSSKEDLIFKKIMEILTKHGTVKSAAKKRFNLFYLLSYTGKAIRAENIKIEINRRNFGSKYEVKTFLGIAMKVMIKEDMLAHKLVAMLERMGKANRDIFDVHFFLSNRWSINDQLVEQRSHLTFIEFLKKTIEALEKLNELGVLSGLGELVTEKQKVWIRTQLKSDTLFSLRLLLHLTEEQSKIASGNE